MKIIKRDGTVVPFAVQKIADAILKAMNKVNNLDGHDAISMQVASHIERSLIDQQVDIIPLEKLQDRVEEFLMRAGLYDTAKEYILYRQQRSDVRMIKGKLNDTIKSLVDVTVDNDDKRENANIDARSTMGTLLKVGTTVLKEFNLQTYFKDKHVQMHRDGVIHMHI